MTFLQQKCSELALLIKSYLLKEHENERWIQADADEYLFFKQFTPRQREEKKSPSLVAAKSPSYSFRPIPSPTTLKPLLEKTHIPPVNTIPIPTKETASFVLEPCTQPTYDDLDDIRQIVLEKVPSIKIFHNIPVNTRNVSASLIPEAIFLCFNEDLEHLPFLKSIAKAVTERLAPAIVIPTMKIEQEKGWKRLTESTSFRLIIAPGEKIQAVPDLKDHIYEKADKSHQFLGKTPLLSIVDVSLYLNQPHLKSVLWKSLCEILSPQTK